MHLRSYLSAAAILTTTATALPGTEILIPTHPRRSPKRTISPPSVPQPPRQWILQQLARMSQLRLHLYPSKTAVSLYYTASGKQGISTITGSATAATKTGDVSGSSGLTAAATKSRSATGSGALITATMTSAGTTDAGTATATSGGKSGSMSSSTGGAAPTGFRRGLGNGGDAIPIVNSVNWDEDRKIAGPYYDAFGSHQDPLQIGARLDIFGIAETERDCEVVCMGHDLGYDFLDGFFVSVAVRKELEGHGY
ncbi:hypothetical protein EYC80_006560 [Monilinia laxa]|uniref:Uncharacterized protein n=1 Tax=Monilinia laxa TaxID=61186 RepID=A0A5N6JT21_MONLA|nr:hypothetical protein EYC80_006560 [Monilinia laxa]